MDANDPILIFGGVDGIGGDLAQRLASAGHRVAITSRSHEKASVSAAAIAATPLTVDVRDEASIVNAVAAATPDGRLSGLVYAVGSIPLKPLSRATAQDFLDAYSLNVVGAALAVKHAAAALKAAQGSVVLFSSVAAGQVSQPRRHWSGEGRRVGLDVGAGGRACPACARQRHRAEPLADAVGKAHREFGNGGASHR